MMQHGIWQWLAICDTVAKPVVRSIASSFFNIWLTKVLKIFLEKLSGRCNVFIISVPRSAIRALKSVVEDSFSNKEMRTFTHLVVSAHISLQVKHLINTSLWRSKTKSSSVNYFAIVVLATNKTCGQGRIKWARGPGKICDREAP